ncbi:hypothetical protein SASPL_120995 [Salvia splendens]|uniref:MSP domain-containing protein n=1 Tax=Salvia splendens TaxID=180675 RepID=A0A8X8XVA3_SALSN|nr:hypothetical protein SASPL_120995 [Salvia splendens]
MPLLRVQPRKMLVFCCQFFLLCLLFSANSVLSYLLTDFSVFHLCNFNCLVERRGDRRASSTFRIWNDSPELIVAFKVKTTDRLKFSGSPIYGILMPRSHCDVDGVVFLAKLILVTVHGQVEALFKIQHADNVIIKSLRASESDTVESIRSLFTERKDMEDYKLSVAYTMDQKPSNFEFTEREDMVEDEKLSVAYAMHQKPSNFEIGIVVLLTCFAFLYFATLILSHIRALISLITILVVRVGLWMMKSKALDAAEEWIKSTLLYLSFCFLAAIKEYVLDLCWGWLKVIYKAFPGLCDSLYLYVFGPQVRGQRPRRRY